MAQNERLISLDKAIEYMEKHKEMAKQHNIVLVANEDAIIKFLKEKCPTVDAVEVVHGRWIVSGCGFDLCSECRKVYADGYLTAMGIKARTQFNYCPNCGAKMDGGNEDENS